jgi:hypothetical protein
VCKLPHLPGLHFHTTQRIIIPDTDSTLQSDGAEHIEMGSNRDGGTYIVRREHQHCVVPKPPVFVRLDNVLYGVVQC